MKGRRSARWRLGPPAAASRMILRVHAFACAAALAAAADTASCAGAEAGAWAWSLTGLADARVHVSDVDATRLVPNPARHGRERRFASVTAVADGQAWSGPIAVSGAGRLYARTAPSGGDRAQLHVDELHAEYVLTPEHFLFAGRRHIVHGQSLGVNPLDFALDPVALDRSKDSTRRRRETEGQDMLGFESLLGARFTLTGYWTPGERALLAGTLTLPDRQSDLTALVVDDDRPGAGLSFSRTLGEAVLAYADVAARRGRDRMRIHNDRRPDAYPGTFATEEGDDSRFFARSSIGAGYTLDSGATFNVEHHFDANGYSNGEWDEITDLIVEGDTARSEERFGELAERNLLRLSAHFARFTMRRHYGFLRARHPDLFGGGLALEATVLHGLADHSGSMGLRLEREIGPNLLLGVEGRWPYGEDLDEFALRTAGPSGSIHLTAYF